MKPAGMAGEFSTAAFYPERERAPKGIITDTTSVKIKV